MSEAGDAGRSIYELARRLYPLPRSITGDGTRQTLKILSEHIPLEVHEVASGTSVLDWTVPDEWNIRDAWIADTHGRRIVDFRESNLHVVSYSQAVRRRMPHEELLKHLHWIDDRPDWIPYRTGYYKAGWGFCLSKAQLEQLQDTEYEVCIDATLEPGHLSLGEATIPGESREEVVFFAHVCHPSLANDNLSGIATAVYLARWLATSPRRYSYRFVFAPVTIGAITWLAQNRSNLEHVKHGLSLVCLGDGSPFTYKKTYAGDLEIDRIVTRVLAELPGPHQVIDFFPYGYDERQFNSPGFRLPVGSLMRGRHGQFPEYHTSADDLDFISPERLDESWRCCRRIVEFLEVNHRYRNLAPHGEPQLGKRGVYDGLGGRSSPGALELAIFWLLSCSDGTQSLLDIAERSSIDYATLREAAELLVQCSLLVAAEEDGPAQ